MFASAAILDAYSKQKRRLRWEQLIAEAKARPPSESCETSPFTTEELESFARAEKNLTEAGDPRQLAVMDQLHKDARTRYARRADLESYRPTPLQSQRILMAIESCLPHEERASQHSVTEDARSVDMLHSRDAPKHSVYYNYVSSESKRMPRDPIHFQRAEETVAKLVSFLLLNPYASKRPSLATNAHNIADFRATEVESILHEQSLGAVQLPSYIKCHNRSYQVESEALGTSIARIIGPTAGITTQNNEFQRQTIAKLCYNLLVSPAPPDAATYTMLIDRFTSLKWYDHARMVVDIVQHNTVLKPSTKTMQAILRHYRVTNDRSGFDQTIRRMNLRWSNMYIKRFPIENAVTPANMELLTSRPNRYKRSKHDIFLKPARDMDLFNECIEGMLHFRKLRQAIIYVGQALRNGCCLSASALHGLVAACMHDTNVALDLTNREVAMRLLKTLSQESVAVIELMDVLFEPLRALLYICGIGISKDLGWVTGLHPDLPEYRPIVHIVHNMRRPSGAMTDVKDFSLADLNQPFDVMRDGRSVLSRELLESTRLCFSFEQKIDASSRRYRSFRMSFRASKRLLSAIATSEERVDALDRKLNSAVKLHQSWERAILTASGARSTSIQAGKLCTLQQEEKALRRQIDAENRRQKNIKRIEGPLKDAIIRHASWERMIERSKKRQLNQKPRAAVHIETAIGRFERPDVYLLSTEEKPIYACI